ncbi:2-oxoglutarate dehydrogenase E1 component, partial [bacterium]|nr:2-oxoglutarate dehydrogenase E1 component [bacterium]
MKHTTIANRWNADLIDENYDIWRTSPEALDSEWKAFFEGFELAQEVITDTGDSDIANVSPTRVDSDATKQSRVIGLIYAYRSIGHTIAAFNPLNVEVPANPRLTLERLGFEESDLDRVFHTGNYLGGTEMTLRKLIERLQKTYCHTIGAEYIHIQETPKRRWIQARIEPECFVPRFTKEEKQRILRTIMNAEDFENFLQTRFVG